MSKRKIERLYSEPGIMKHFYTYMFRVKGYESSHHCSDFIFGAPEAICRLLLSCHFQKCESMRLCVIVLLLRGLLCVCAFACGPACARGLALNVPASWVAAFPSWRWWKNWQDFGKTSPSNCAGSGDVLSPKEGAIEEISGGTDEC